MAKTMAQKAGLKPSIKRPVNKVRTVTDLAKERQQIKKEIQQADELEQRARAKTADQIRTATVEMAPEQQTLLRAQILKGDLADKLEENQKEILQAINEYPDALLRDAMKFYFLRDITPDAAAFLACMSKPYMKESVRKSLEEIIKA